MTSFRNHLQRFGAGVILAGLALGAGTGIASAQWYNGPPPPPPPHEYHAFHRGYVWEGGHYRRIAGRWVWAPGHLVAVRPGQHWIGGHWQYGPRGRYWVGGHYS
jgi:hypothetical protein